MDSLHQTKENNIREVVLHLSEYESTVLKKDNAWLNVELWHPNEIQYYGVTHIYLRHTDIFDMFQNDGHDFQSVILKIVLNLRYFEVL